MEENLPVIKDEKIAELFTIRASLSVVSQNTDKIREYETRISNLNNGKREFEIKKNNEYGDIAAFYDNKIREINNLMDLAADEKRLLKSIRGGKTSLYDIKKEKENFRQHISENVRAPEGGSGVALFFLSITVLSLLCFLVAYFIFGANISNNVPLMSCLAFFGGTGFTTYIILKIWDIMNVSSKFSIFRLPKLKECKRKWKEAWNEYRKLSSEVCSCERIYKSEIPTVLEQDKKDIANLKAEKEFKLKEKLNANGNEKIAFNENADIEIKKINDEIKIIAGINQKITNVVAKTYSWFCESDWQNIDLVIFYLQTGRADTIKEALYQVDRQRQTEQIVKVISQATQYLVKTINDNFSGLEETVKKCFASLSDSVSFFGRQIKTALDENTVQIGRQIEGTKEISEIQNKLLTETALNNGLLAKANETSDELLNDLRYQQKYWVK